MPTWRRIEPIDIDDQINRAVIREVWYTQDLSVDNPEHGELINSVPVQKGQPHSDPFWSNRGCICVSRRLVYGPLRRCAKVLVTYDTNIRFGFGYYPRTNRSNRSLSMDLLCPIIKSTATVYSGLGVPLDGATQCVMMKLGVRPTILRNFTFDRYGNADLISATIAPNVGKRYFLRLTNGAAGPPVSVDGDEPQPDGIQIVLTDWSVTDLGNTFCRVRYEFRWYGPVRAMDGDDIGSLADLPALGELDEYDVPFDNPAAFIGETIGVVSGLKLYAPGSPLP